VYWIDLAQDRSKWWAVMYTGINSAVRRIQGTCLLAEELCVSGRTLLHAVDWLVGWLTSQSICYFSNTWGILLTVLIKQNLYILIKLRSEISFAIILFTRENLTIHLLLVVRLGMHYLYLNFFICYHCRGAHSGAVGYGPALKLAGHGFDSPWCHWNFSLT
jgi:hypothetical protein